MLGANGRKRQAEYIGALERALSAGYGAIPPRRHKMLPKIEEAFRWYQDMKLRRGRGPVGLYRLETEAPDRGRTPRAGFHEVKSTIP